MSDLTWQKFDWQQLAADPSASSQAFLTAQTQYLPDYVKQAHLVEPADHARLPDHLFALIVDQDAPLGQTKQAVRLFPVPDRAHTYLQQEALRHTADRLPAAAAKTAAWHIAMAAQRHGVPLTDKVASLAQGMAGRSNRVAQALFEQAAPGPTAAQKQAAAAAESDDLYGLVKQGRRRYPLHTPALIKQAMDYLATHEGALPIADRYQLATKTAKRAQAEGLAITEKVASYTYDGTYADTVGSAMAARTDYARAQCPEAVGTLAALGASIDGGAEPWKVASALAQWDQETGYQAHAERVGAQDAHRALLGGATKQAALDPERTSIRDLDDRQIAALVQRHQTKLSSTLGPQVVRQMVEAPRQTLEAFDDDQQHTIKLILAGQL